MATTISDEQERRIREALNVPYSEDTDLVTVIHEAAAALRVMEQRCLKMTLAVRKIDSVLYMARKEAREWALQDSEYEMLMAYSSLWEEFRK